MPVEGIAINGAPKRELPEGYQWLGLPLGTFGDASFGRWCAARVLGFYPDSVGEGMLIIPTNPRLFVVEFDAPGEVLKDTYEVGMQSIVPIRVVVLNELTRVVIEEVSMGLPLVIVATRDPETGYWHVMQWQGSATSSAFPDWD